MPRRRASQTSISSELSNSSEQSENLTLNEEFPDTGLPELRGKGGKKKKSVSFNLDDGKSKKKPIDLTEVPSTSQTQLHEVILICGKQKENHGELIDITAATSSTEHNKKEKDEKNKKQKQPEAKPLKVNPPGVNKIYKVGECIKSMNIELHPALFSAWYMADLPREASAAGVAVIPAHDICDPCALMWTQNTSKKITSTDGMIRLTPHKAQVNRCLYIMTASEVAELVASKTLADHLAHKRELIGGRLTLVVYNASDYFKKSTRRVAHGLMQQMTEVDLEVAVTDLMIGLKIETIQVNTSSELAILIVQYTRAIAEEPFKRAKRDIDEQAQFYMRGDNRNCVSVDKDGNGLSRVWQQMVAVLPMSSLEISRSLCSQYNSPRALATELETSDGVTRVSELGVSRAAAPTARTRRLGPEFARKLHTLFTADDGNLVIE